MALANDYVYVTAGRTVSSLALTSGVTAYDGALLGLSPSTGKAVLWSDTSGILFMGIAMRRAVGDANLTEVSIDTAGLELRDVAVTGASAITDQGDKIYATDDNTFTKTPTANVGPIGYIKRWRTATKCDVQLYTPEEYQAWSGV
jgi:hypothetical protein